ncbi:uncharacterized protein B0I36DRAFT_290692 [Microdochium trichocladiopsis]|uniref:FAD-binding domain-containing protein n=1 Tax=Microdochium trichocladiopsis TaxID=1682393 RepID=A0A9P9BPG3_9PEZI|nr:uncharacterized protein B0I36DRAFT_290692 [Microdochium trichocladiopsis]KAH7029217.1 hypothetical protein B0I36DRAFT_290692 [Microdochium trichocladiopsis]
MGASTTFKVIIAGAGPVGLLMAHALSRAGVDFVVLEEQDEVVRHAGAGIALMPGLVRILDQIGVLEHIKRQVFLRNKMDLVTNGTVLQQWPLFDLVAEAFGYRIIQTSRKDVIEALFTTLPGHSERVKTASKVSKVDLRDDGVTVHLANGATVDGSILIGCDGVHSRTRQIMQQLREEAGGSAAVDDDATVMERRFAGIYGRVDNPVGIAPGFFYESREAGFLMQMSVGDDVLWYVLLRHQLPSPGRTRYTAEECDEFAKALAHLQIAPLGLTFGDIWARTDKETAVLVDQQQGCAEKWHHGGRIVLVGDSQLKVTSESGAGFMAGAYSAVQLANELQDLLSKQSGPGQPSASDLDAAFARYQVARMPASKAMLESDIARLDQSMWGSWKGWLMDRWVVRMPWVDMAKIFKTRAIPRMAGAPVLRYVPFEGKSGTAEWQIKVPRVEAL